MSLLRTAKQDQIYEEYKKNGGLSGTCPLCDAKPIKEFDNWRIIDNRFPYDKIASTHHMIIPKKHFKESALTEVDLKELSNLKSGYIAENYEFIIEATLGVKTVPSHFHLHLVVIDKSFATKA